MELSIGEKIRIILKRKGITMYELADMLGTSRQNLSNKFRRDNFTEQEADNMAGLLGYSFETCFKDRNSKDKI